MRVLSEMDELGPMAAEAARRPEWEAFSRYCEQRSRGARKQALADLDAFVRQARIWPPAARRDFVAWLIDKSEQSPAGAAGALFDYSSSALLPKPLMKQLVEPTLREWVTEAPGDAQVHLWLGRLRTDAHIEHLYSALRLDPGCEEARRLICRHAMRNIGYHQHEMPRLYITDPRDDLTWIGELEDVVRPSSDAAWREKVLAELEAARRVARAWLEAHPAPGDFAVR